MKLSFIARAFCALSLCIATVATAAPRLFAVNPFANTGATAGDFGLYEINPTNAAVISSTLIAVPSRTITGANSITLDPTTGVVYGIVRATGVTGRLLITLNLATGAGVEIGNLGDNFSSLTFRSDGQLFGVTGNGASVPETLYTINKATGVPTLAVALGNGADGEVIAFNPVDSQIYHWSGNSSVFYERFPSTSPYTPITSITTGALPGGEVFGAVWDPTQNLFLVSNINSELRTLSTTGVQSAALGTMPNDLRGMVLIDSQTITGFAPSSPVTVGAPAATLTATGGGSGNPIVFATTSPPSVCTVSGATVTFVGIGTCNLTANQAAGGIYTAAPEVTASITINPIASVIIGFSPPASATAGGTVILSATGAPSGAPIVFATSSAPSVCTVSGTTVSLVGIGTCNLTADQAALGNYAAAAQVTASVTITPIASVITGFSPPASATAGGTVVLSAAGAPSGAQIVFATTSAPSVCTVSGATVTLVGIGTCNLTADQAAAGNYAAATQVTGSIAIGAIASVISPISAPSSAMVGASVIVSATGAPSGAPIVFSTTTPSVCSVSGSVVTIFAPGSCMVIANQAAAGNYAAATSVSVTISAESVAKVPTLGLAGLLALSCLLAVAGLATRQRRA